jgi:hypothetical protein
VFNDVIMLSGGKQQTLRPNYALFESIALPGYSP